MFNCSDSAIAYLKSIGYNVILQPREGFVPLMLLGLSGKTLSVEGALDGVMSAPTPLPTVTSVQAANVNGNRSSDLKVDVGLALLGNLISALGGNKIGIDAGYRRAKTVQFEFTDVTLDGIQRTQLDLFLTNASLMAGRAVTQLFEADKIYVVTSVLKSKKILVDAKDTAGVNVGADVPVIANAVGGNIKVGLENNASTKVLYEGQTPMPFGFQAVQLEYENGVYLTYRDLANPRVVAKGLRADEHGPITDQDAASAGLLRVEGNFVRFK